MLLNRANKNGDGILQAKEEVQPYLPSDPNAVSLSYLAQISSDVYGGADSSGEANEQERTSISSGIVEIGPDRFAIHEHVQEGSRTLFVAICGTSSPVQHVMNVMPHAFKGLQLVEQALTTKDSNNTNQQSRANDHDAYQEGFVQGWKDPASNIYEEVIRLCSSHEEETNDSKIDLNEKYDRIIFTGHSRGGLLAYHASVFCSTGTHTQPPYRGSLGVVGFGMPPPMSPPSDPVERSVCVQSVLSVFHNRDPVSNGSVLKFPVSWNPAQTLSLALSPEEEREKARKLQEQQQAKRASASSLRGGSGFWGAVGNLVQTAVTAVGDSASELAKNIEVYHSMAEYIRKISSGNGSLSKKDVTREGSFVVEKRIPENQWVLSFPDPPNRETP